MRSVIGTKGARTGIAAVVSCRVIGRTVRRFDVAHVQNGIDRAANPRHKDDFGLLDIRKLVRFEIGDPSRPNISINDLGAVISWKVCP